MGTRRDLDTGKIDYTTDNGKLIDVGFRIASEDGYKDAAKAFASWNITDDNSGKASQGFEPRRIRLKIEDKTTIDLGTGTPGGNDNYRTVDIIIPKVSLLIDLFPKCAPKQKFNGKKIVSAEYIGEKRPPSYFDALSK